jgi:hypothetical protein
MGIEKTNKGAVEVGENQRRETKQQVVAKEKINQ